jgi:hypothetical protein
MSDALRVMEHFHAQFTGVTSQRTGGGTALMYASAARQLTDTKDKNKAQQILKEFKDKLRERVPSLAEFEAALLEVQYTDESTRQKALVQYLLARIDGHFRGGASAIPNYDILTIEHLAPQSLSKGWNVSRSVVGALGNLVLVNESLNSKLANKPFDVKKKLLTDAQVPLDPVLKDASAWGDKEILERGKRLAKILHETILKV